MENTLNRLMSHANNKSRLQKRKSKATPKSKNTRSEASAADTIAADQSPMKRETQHTTSSTNNDQLPHPKPNSLVQALFFKITISVLFTCIVLFIRCSLALMIGIPILAAVLAQTTTRILLKITQIRSTLINMIY